MMNHFKLGGWTTVFALTAFNLVAQPAKHYNVRDFGGKGDGVTYDTAAIQKAFDQCAKFGGTVVLPKGRYLAKPLVIGTRTTLLIEEGATLLASTNQNDFLKAPGDWLKAKSNSDFVPFLSGKDLENVTIAGAGTIEGSGHVWWEEAEKARRQVSGFTLPRPNLIVLTRAKNLVVRDVTIQNSPKFHLVPTECDDVLITNVTFLAPDAAANTDAIDPSVSRRVTITRCLIDVGDDNVAVKSGKRLDGREFACEDLTITDCVFRHGHGMSIGSETVGGVKNIIVRNCRFEGTENGIRIKSDRKRGGTIENFLCENIAMSNVVGAITITSYYPKIPTNDVAQPVTDTTPKYRNITIRNLTATSSKYAGVIVGLPESQIENVLLENVSIDAATTGLEFRHAKGVQLKNVRITAVQGEPFLTRDAQVSGLPKPPTVQKP